MFAFRSCLFALLAAAIFPLNAQPVPPWATHVSSAWANSTSPLVLSDMGQCLPSTALNSALRAGRWKLMPYELVDGTKGRLVWASPSSGAPPLSLKLPAEGYHAIYIGMFGGNRPGKIFLALKGERAPQSRVLSKGVPWNAVEEVFYGVSDLAAGSALTINREHNGAGVAYVKLIRLTETEKQAFLKDKPALTARTSVATYDGLAILYYLLDLADHRQGLLSTIEGFRDSDFGTILLQYGGADQVPYPSEISARFGNYGDPQAFPEEGHARWLERFEDLKKDGINPYQTLISGIHDLGMTVQVSARPAMWTFWEPYVDFFESPFYRDHPEWRTFDRDGSPVTRMSWAVPEVRAHMIKVIMEAVRMGADGANILFNRGCPVVLYEKPFVEMFQKRHGVDPRELTEPDPRITQMWSDVIVTFMRELRVELDKEADRRGGNRRLVLSASCFGNEEDNMRFGLDIRRLVAEKLLDEVYPYKWDHGAKKRVWDIRYFSEFCKPAGVKLCPVLGSGYQFDTQVQDALSFYEDGADAIGYWDAPEMWNDMRQWSVMSRMGRRDELKQRSKVPGPTLIHIHLLNGQVLDGRYPPYMGG